ncbi:MAG: AAA family ATPase [Pleomorphochaeta sp.]
MLIRLNIGNFLSFNEIQEFSMIAGKVRKNNDRVYEGQNIKLIKFASIFGANASGKSNLVKVFRFARQLIVHKFPDNFVNSYCKINKENKEKISYFDFEIKIDNKYYSYGFEIVLNTQQVKSEWLYEISKTKDKVIFERQVEKGEYIVDKYFMNSDINKKLDIYANDVREKDSVLFLKVLNRDKDSFYIDHPQAKVFNKVYQWFRNSLDVTYPNQPLHDFSFLLRNDDLIKLGNYLKVFKTGISKISRKEVLINQIKMELEPSLIKRIEKQLNDDINNDKQDRGHGIFLRAQNKGYYFFTKDNDISKYEKIEFYHDNTDIPFELFEESDGTIRLIDLISILLNKVENRTFIVDELDRCLHPQLTRRFISEFLNIAREKNNQLIVTSHESRLLNFDLLRKDEIWFTDKNEIGETRIYSLDEFNERFDKKIDTAYLEGRYGAVPIFE